MIENIITEGFVLRKLRESDASSIAKYCNAPEISKYTENIPHPYKLVDAESFIKDCIERWDNETRFAFGIEIDTTVGTYILGTSSSSRNTNVLSFSFIRGHFTVAGATEEFEIYHRCATGTAALTGFGITTGYLGGDIYTQARIEKIS